MLLKPHTVRRDIYRKMFQFYKAMRPYKNDERRSKKFNLKETVSLNDMYTAIKEALIQVEPPALNKREYKDEKKR